MLLGCCLETIPVNNCSMHVPYAIDYRRFRQVGLHSNVSSRFAPPPLPPTSFPLFSLSLFLRPIHSA